MNIPFLCAGHLVVQILFVTLVQVLFVSSIMLFIDITLFLMWNTHPNIQL